MAVSKAMQNYCGGVKVQKRSWRKVLLCCNSYEKEALPLCESGKILMNSCAPMKYLIILEVAKMILQACIFRESSSRPLCFERSDFPKMDPKGR